MSITGLILYIVPQGRIAYWVTWELLGMTKTEWGNIHIISSILFIIAGAFHIYFNWSILLNYFKKKAEAGIRLKKELSIAGIVSLIIVVGALYSIPPISYLLDFNEFIKDSWIVSDEYEPPFGHAEELSLKTFSAKMEIDLGKAFDELKANGIDFESTEQSLLEIAEKNGVSPMDLYMLIKKFEPSKAITDSTVYTAEMVEIEFSGTGIGNRSFQGICESFGIDISLARSRLARNGIDIKADDTLKKTAERYDTESIELLKAILVEGYEIPESNN
jgi:hypothetical protein